MVRIFLVGRCVFVSAMLVTATACGSNTVVVGRAPATASPVNSAGPSSSPASAPTASPASSPKITASPSGAPSTPSASPSPAAVDGIFVANVGNGGSFPSITAYAANPSGTLNETPLGTISGANTGLSVPDGIALDASGNIYVANGSGDSLTVYAPNPSGTLDEAPFATIAGSNSEINEPLAVAVDNHGEIYVLGEIPSGGGYSASITVYPPVSSGSGTLNEAPSATISGSSTGLSAPNGIAVDGSGYIYVVNGYDAGSFSITVYPPIPSGGGTLNESPIATITGSSTGLNHPYGIAVDVSGNIYVTNPGTGTGVSVSVYATIPYGGGSLDETPLGTITGTSTGLEIPTGIAVAPSDDIYVADAGALLVFAANPRGTLNEAPLATIQGSSTNLSDPVGIAVPNPLPECSGLIRHPVRSGSSPSRQGPGPLVCPASGGRR